MDNYSSESSVGWKEEGKKGKEERNEGACYIIAKYNSRVWRVTGWLSENSEVRREGDEIQLGMEVGVWLSNDGMVWWRVDMVTGWSWDILEYNFLSC